MKLYRKVDKEGYFIEDVIVEDNRVVDTSKYIESHPPQGLYRPRWDGEARQWVEGLTQTVIDDRMNQPRSSTPEERLSFLEQDYATLIYDSMAKEVRIEEGERMNAELLYIIMTGGM